MSTLIEQVERLPGLMTYTVNAARSGKTANMGRWAAVEISREFLRIGEAPSLGAFIEHPDMPSDARPIFWFDSYMTGTIQVVFESSEWELIPEGMSLPKIDLIWRKEKNGNFLPTKHGSQPEYLNKVKCPHCKHAWPGRV